MADEELCEARHARPVLVWLLGAAVVVAAVIVLVARHDGSRPRAATRTATRTAPSTLTSSATPRPSSSAALDPLALVPAQDMRAELGTAVCHDTCVAHVLIGPALTRAGAGFAGLRPIAAGLVTRGGDEPVLRSLEGRSSDGVGVYLYSERVRLADTAVGVTDTLDPATGRSHTVVLAAIRRGWRLTATLTGPEDAAAQRAARRWIESSPLPR